MPARDVAAGVNAGLSRVRVRGVRGSLFELVGTEAFDCIASNPPCVPSTSEALPVRGLSRAWEAGADGRVVVDRICREAHRHLRPGGVLLLVHSTMIGEQRTRALLAATGLEVEVVQRRRGPLGPLMRRCVEDEAAAVRRKRRRVAAAAVRPR